MESCQEAPQPTLSKVYDTPKDPLVKVSVGNRAFNNFELQSGLNVDHHPFTPRACEAGGLHACALSNSFWWIGWRRATHIWDVEFRPEDVEQGRIAYFDNKVKARALILSNPRLIAEDKDLAAMAAAAVNGDPGNLNRIPLIMQTQEMVDGLVAIDPRAFLYVRSDLRSRVMCESVMQRALAEASSPPCMDVANTLGYIPSCYRSDAMCDAVVAADPWGFVYTPVPYRTLDRCVAACRRANSLEHWVPAALAREVKRLLGPPAAKPTPVPRRMSSRLAARIAHSAHK